MRGLGSWEISAIIGLMGRGSISGKADLRVFRVSKASNSHVNEPFKLISVHLRSNKSLTFLLYP